MESLANLNFLLSLLYEINLDKEWFSKDAIIRLPAELYVAVM